MCECVMGDGNVQTDMHAQFWEVLTRVELLHNLSVLQQLRDSVADSSQAKTQCIYTGPPTHPHLNKQVDPIIIIIVSVCLSIHNMVCQQT